MQIHHPGAEIRDEGEFPVHVNDSKPTAPFAVISLSQDGYSTELTFRTQADADRLIRAISRARYQLGQRLYGPAHPFQPDDRRICTDCGCLKSSPVHIIEGDVLPRGARPADSIQAGVIR